MLGFAHLFFLMLVMKFSSSDAWCLDCFVNSHTVHEPFHFHYGLCLYWHCLSITFFGLIRYSF
jgi:hypothetical protein